MGYCMVLVYAYGGSFNAGKHGAGAFTTYIHGGYTYSGTACS